jgi:hypothetical protein
MVQSQDRSLRLERYRRLVAYQQSGDPAMREAVSLLTQRLEAHRLALVDCPPDQVGRLQGRALELTDILKIIHNTSLT